MAIAKSLYVGSKVNLDFSNGSITANTIINNKGYMINTTALGTNVVTDLKVINKRTRTSQANATNCVSTWTTRVSAADNQWNSIVWAPELGLFVSVASSGTGNRVMTSPDGTIWTTRTSATDNDWNSIAWSGFLTTLVAVSTTGVGNRVMTSSNGITWTSRTSAADNTWRDIVRAPELGLFVSVASSGTGNRVMTSPDGITWTIRTSASDNNWEKIAWSPELILLVAVSTTGTGNRIMTSPDGITWTSRTSPADNTWRSITWSPELYLFVAVASSGTGNRVMTSPDGITWTIGTTPADNQWEDIVWSPDLSIFTAVAFSGTGNRVMTSPNGFTWTIRTNSVDNDFRNITWSPELSIFACVSVSGTGNRVMTSAFGIPNSKNVTWVNPFITQAEFYKFSDVKTAGSNGGGATTGSFQIRTLNTSSIFPSSANKVALASNVLTFQPGSYHVRIESPFYNTSETATRFYDVTNAVTLSLGNTSYTTAATGLGIAGGISNIVSSIESVHTFAVATQTRVEYRVTVNPGTTALGRAHGFQQEVYTQVFITYLGTT
jgi:hypothetical protein